MIVPSIKLTIPLAYGPDRSLSTTTVDVVASVVSPKTQGIISLVTHLTTLKICIRVGYYSLL